MLIIVMFSRVEPTLSKENLEQVKLPFNNRIKSITESETLPVGKHATPNDVSKPSTVSLLNFNQSVPFGKSLNNSRGSFYLEE